jgi:hypothetical protein
MPLTWEGRGRAPRMWAYLIVTGFYVLVAASLAMLGIRSLKNVKGPERAIAQAQETMETLTRAQPGQLVRAEHQDGDQCDDRQLGKSDSEHGSAPTDRRHGRTGVYGTQRKAPARPAEVNRVDDQPNAALGWLAHPMWKLTSSSRPL